MKYKKSMIMLVLLIFIFGVASVSASDVNDTVIAGADDSAVELPQADADEIISTDENELIGQTENELISEGDSGNFTELKANIAQATEGSTLILNKNYECEDGFDTAGILIDKSITIDGNGSKIDAQGKSRIFKITAENVMLKNIIFTNGNTTEEGGAVYFEKSGTVINCNFTDNEARYGGAVYFEDSGNVTNCNFTGNKATESGGAVYFLDNGAVTNCNFTCNTATVWGGAVCFYRTGSVENCNFTGNTATEKGGAIYMRSGNVSNCNFTGNTADYGGAVYFLDNGDVSNCNFTGNTASQRGGAITIYSGNVTNCTFTDNSASNGGAVFFYSRGNVTNCNFSGNNATNGSAIYFFRFYSTGSLTISNSIFLNNRANAEALTVTKNENNITITFTGQNNLLNAIYSMDGNEVTFTNVTYLGANGITNTSSSATTPSRSNKAAGQNITVCVVVNDKLVLDNVYVTDENGTIVLNTAGMIATETPVWADIAACAIPLLYVGVLSSGVAYTLQILAQKGSNPTVVSLLMSLESVFATVFGALILHELMSGREIFGCGLMLVAVVLAQLPASK